MEQNLKRRSQLGVNMLHIMIGLVMAGVLMAGTLLVLASMAPKNAGAAKATPKLTPVSTGGAATVTLDMTVPLSIIVGAVLVFVVFKFVVPALKTRLSAKKVLKASVLQRAADWTALRSRKEDLMLEWAKYETDVALMIDYPIMTDYTDPVVHKVVSAMQKIRTAEMMAIDPKTMDASDSALQGAVDEFELAFHTAEKYARRYGQTRLDPREQRKLSTARTALNIILDGDAPAFEVEAAYKSLRSSLKGIIDLPQRAIAELESKVRRELVAA